MLRPRIIPCLLVRNRGLVKTVKFGESRYIGDPINAVKIFNEKEVDELIVLDIDATAEGREPDYDMIAKLAAECRMPFCDGGGIKSTEQAERIIGLGVEKISIGSAAVMNPDIISGIADRTGNQSVVAVLDIKKRMIGNKKEVYINNGKEKTGKNPVELARAFEDLGAGELLLNFIDRDGVMDGYDTEYAGLIRREIGIPLTVLGGAGSLDDIGDLIESVGIIGAAAGSLFVFKGAYKAVLINYPDASDREAMLDKYLYRN